MKRAASFGRSFAAFTVALLMAAAASLYAQEDTHPTQQPPNAQVSTAPEPGYGTAATILHTVGPWQFDYLNPTLGATAYNNARRSCTGGCYIEAPVNLPSGASITGLEVEACDSHATEDWALAFYYTPVNGAFVLPTGGFVDSTGTPGCVTQSSSLASPLTVDNAANSYHIEWNNGAATDATVSLRAVRIRYRLQVSPAPALATFGDVPTTSPYFRFVEALVAAGIVGGCGGSNYCPASPVTRGQMAVFLAVALGMHFPN